MLARMSTSDTVILGERHQAMRGAATAFVTELESTLTGDSVELPSLPEVALRIRQALATKDVGIDHVVDIVGTDPALAARLLKVANCALFHRGTKPINDLQTAVMRLGLQMVRNVSISLAAQQVFIGYASEEIRPHIQEVWGHSVQVATLAHLLATRSKVVPPDEAFLAGLVHEIGRLYILMRARDHADLFEDESAFEAIVAQWQSRIGARIASEWAFPDELVAAVGDHDSCDLACGPDASVTNVVAVANYLAERITECGDEDEIIDGLADLGSLTPDHDTLAWMLRVSSNEIRALQSAMDIGAPERRSA